MTKEYIFPRIPLVETVYKRNFIKENMRHIKQMQGLLPQSEAKFTAKDDAYTNKQNKQKSGSLTRYRNRSEQTLQERPKTRIDAEKLNRPTRVRSKLGDFSWIFYHTLLR